ncbi:MAG: hypothetical protein RL477_2204, partial [Pseudomonadota bacterium]
GTPTDCVLIAVGEILGERPPDLVLSGINHGGNMAEDISHSGTVAAAIQATVMGIPGIAFSLIVQPEHPAKWATAEHFAPLIVRKLAARPWKRDVVINVNFPDRVQSAVTGIEVARQGRRRMIERVTEAIDPFGRPYYWIGSPRKEGPGKGDSDLEVTGRGAVAVTPLNLDLTDGAEVKVLGRVFR